MITVEADAISKRHLATTGYIHHDRLTALREVASDYYGEAGAWSYNAFDEINRRFFRGELEPPLIRFELLAYGRALGDCHRTPTGRPVIRLAPMLAGVTFCGPGTRIASAPGAARFMRDVLLHELIHQSVHERRGGSGVSDSHNNLLWIAELNRIAPLLGFDGFKAGRYQARRIPKAEGGGVRKCCPPDCVPYEEVFRFPHATYRRLDPGRYGALGDELDTLDL